MKLISGIKDEKASVTIEASVAMVTFTLVIVFLLTFVNVGRAQALIQNAINKSCMEMSQYMYLYEATGLYYQSVDFDGSGEKAAQNVGSLYTGAEGMYSGVSSMFSNISGGVSSLQQEDYMSAIISGASVAGDYKNITSSYDNLESSIGDISEDPSSFIKGLGKVGLGAGNSYLFGAVLGKALAVNYLGADTNGSDEAIADKKLKALGVVDGLDGLNFKRSTIFHSTSPTNLNIVVTYKVKIFPMLGDFSVNFAQSASTRAWLGGDGTVIVGSKGKATEESVMNNSGSSTTTSSAPSSEVTTSDAPVVSAVPDENGNFG